MTNTSRSRPDTEPVEIRLCCGSGCIAHGAMDVYSAIRERAATSGLEIILRTHIGFVGCRGFCSEGPLLHLPEPDILYCRVTTDDIDEILHQTVDHGELVERLLYEDPVGGGCCRGVGDNPFFLAQKRRVLRRCGVVDPEDLDHAISLGAYEMLGEVLRAGNPGQVVDRVKRSGLQERAGGGFPVGLKWAVVAESPGELRYVVANGEDGDPGPTASRVLIESDPHGVIEGMAIAAYAVGANAGRLFLRSEQRLAVARAELAVAQATHSGFLGRDICGCGFDFSVEVCESGGAMMGGDETAVLNIIEGKRGTARPRPPFPAVSGLWSRPTLISSFETLANVPLVVGENEPADIPAGETKVVGLSGRARRPGVAEVPLGVSIADVVASIGGGCAEGETRAVHVGGLGGATLRPDQLGTALDYSTIRELQANLATAGLVVLGEHDCPVALTRDLISVCAEASCGTCPPCRIGTRVVLKVLERFVAGEAETQELVRLESLGRHILRTALCEHGRNAARSVLVSLEHFRSTYESRLSGSGDGTGRCP